MHTYYTQDIDLDSIAQAAGLSKFHFTRPLTLIHGLTPGAYLQRKRARAAARLIQRSSTLTTEEIAAAVGFQDKGALHRQLRCWRSELCLS